jgi:hypothetical protein
MNTEKILPLPPAGKYGFFVGATAGLVGWIVGSPIFGILLGNYQTGDIVGKIAAAILMGLFSFFLLRKYGCILIDNQSTKVQIIWSIFISFVTYMAVHYGGLTVVFKEFVDSLLQKTSDNTWAFSYMLAFGFFGIVVGSFVEAINSLSEKRKE